MPPTKSLKSTAENEYRRWSETMVAQSPKLGDASKQLLKNDLKKQFETLVLLWEKTLMPLANSLGSAQEKKHLNKSAVKPSSWVFQSYAQDLQISA